VLRTDDLLVAFTISANVRNLGTYQKAMLFSGGYKRAINFFLVNGLSKTKVAEPVYEVWLTTNKI
jgi:hypothetical protein